MSISEMDTVPSMPSIPAEWSGYEQAQALREVCLTSGLDARRAGRLLKLLPETAACLKWIWSATPTLKALLQKGVVHYYPASLLARLEQHGSDQALALARAFIRGTVNVAAIESALEAREQVREGSARQSEGLRGRP